MDRVCRNVDSVLFRTKGMRKKNLQRGVILKVLNDHFNSGVYCYFVRNSNIDDRMYVRQIMNGLLQLPVISAINMKNAKSDNKLYPITIGNRLFTALNRACNKDRDIKIISTINIQHILNIIQNEDADVETIIQLLYKKTNSIMYFKIGDIYIGDDFYVIDIIPLNGKNTITLTNKVEIIENLPVKKKKSQIKYTRVK